MPTTKRIFDVITAILLGLLLFPVMLIIVLVIKCTSPGPALFRQKRLGLNGEVFLINKFRKFPSDWGSKGPGVTLQFDSRMTRVGRFLERTKLDELPQLWNILVGEMSFVGPRPESLSFAHLFDSSYKEVLSYKPGIFGPNQTAYRNESAMYPDGEDPVAFYERELFPAKAQNDIDYFKKATFFGDLKWIISGTFALIFSAIIWRKSMRNSVILLVWDIGSVLVAWTVMHWLKYQALRSVVIKPTSVGLFKSGFIIIPLVLCLVFAIARVYRHPVRYFSSTDMYRLVGATCALWMLSGIVFKLAPNSTSSMLLSTSCLLSVIIMCIPRVVCQQWFSHNDNRVRAKRVGSRVRVAVCGTDVQSISLCNLLIDGFERANVVGLISDDQGHVRREIHGIEVIGMWSDLDVLSARYQFQQLWLGTNLSKNIEHEVKMWCSENNVELVSLENLKGFDVLTGLETPEKHVLQEHGDNNLAPSPTPKPSQAVV